jgi:hypothetical protein
VGEPRCKWKDTVRKNGVVMLQIRNWKRQDELENVGGRRWPWPENRQKRHRKRRIRWRRGRKW